jgi:hypothetical protein
MRLMSAVAARLQPPSEQRVFVEIVVERAYPRHRDDPECRTAAADSRDARGSPHEGKMKARSLGSPPRVLIAYSIDAFWLGVVVLSASLLVQRRALG